jgi:hypothetical protein
LERASNFRIQSFLWFENSYSLSSSEIFAGKN